MVQHKVLLRYWFGMEACDITVFVTVDDYARYFVSVVMREFHPEVAEYEKRAVSALLRWNRGTTIRVEQLLAMDEGFYEYVKGAYQRTAEHEFREKLARRAEIEADGKISVQPDKGRQKG